MFFKKVLFLFFLSFSFVDGKTQDTLSDLSNVHSSEYQPVLESFEIEYKHIMRLKIDSSYENSIGIFIVNNITDSLFYKEHEYFLHKKYNLKGKTFPFK